MGWLVTSDVDEFFAEAGEYLEARPVENTVLLSAAESVRRGMARDPGTGAGTGAGAEAGTAGRGPGARGADADWAAVAGAAAPVFGWWRPDGAAGAAGAVAGAFVHTPPWPVVVGATPAVLAADAATVLAGAGREVAGVNGPLEAAAAFGAAWRRNAGASSNVHRHMRLYRLEELTPPDPSPAGAARTASAADRALLVEWQDAFRAEVNDLVNSGTAGLDDRLGHGGFTLWETSGGAVSLAGTTRCIAGMVRVGPVYTPPGLRGRGYAGAVTAEASRAARDAGAREVVLFTDLDNPTSNALYQRIGYRPVSDWIVLAFRPA
ncbi:MAG TPA: GNAT family N-acetyltransferase [Streptosporangiaceae bacterium]|nr:GNAT family N-acetyltransferase [Streptosporangiaceae bacterium]